MFLEQIFIENIIWPRHCSVQWNRIIGKSWVTENLDSITMWPQNIKVGWASGAIYIEHSSLWNLSPHLMDNVAWHCGKEHLASGLNKIGHKFRLYCMLHKSSGKLCHFAKPHCLYPYNLKCRADIKVLQRESRVKVPLAQWSH